VDPSLRPVAAVDEVLADRASDRSHPMVMASCRRVKRLRSVLGAVGGAGTSLEVVT
jgi:hypothetical protein